MNNFKVNWLLKCSYPFRDLDHLPGNPLNENMPIQKSFNGQELPLKLGNYLAHLLLKEGAPSSFADGALKEGKNAKHDSRDTKSGDKASSKA